MEILIMLMNKLFGISFEFSYLSCSCLCYGIFLNLISSKFDFGVQAGI